MAAAAGLALVYLVAPTTPSDRLRLIAARTRGFLYCVSLVGVTGVVGLTGMTGSGIAGVCGFCTGGWGATLKSCSR